MSPPSPTRLRTDLDVPVLVFETETDLAAGFANARQPDTHRLRTWEVAGTAHYDSYGLGVGFGDPGDGRAAPAMLDALLHPTGGLLACATPINSGPQHWVLQAAFSALDTWVRGGRPPAHARPLVTRSLTPVTFAVDAHGNVQGGVRSPQVDAPLAVLSGLGQSGGGFCGLFGTTVPFTAAQLAASVSEPSALRAGVGGRGAARSRARVPARRGWTRPRPGRGGRRHRDVGADVATPARATDLRAVVLVEGISDRVAVEALAARHGRDLDAERVAVVAIGGAQAIGRVLARFGPRGLDVELAGLCDAGEERDFRRALERAGLGRDLTRGAWKRSASSCATPTSRTS